MELVACSCCIATMNDRRRLVTTAAVGPVPLWPEAGHSSGAPSNAKPLLVNGMDDCALPVLLAPPVLIAPDGTMVLYA